MGDEDVSVQRVGRDITCRHLDRHAHKAEVKGVSAPDPVVLLTANEYRAATAQPDWVLVVVTNALSAEPCVRAYSVDDTISAGNPFVRRLDFRSVSVIEPAIL